MAFEEFGATDFDFEESNWELKSRYLQPKIKSETALDEFVEYKYAQDFAKEIDLSKRTFAIVNGSFIFGDFIEALLVENAILCVEMQISTLSLSQENIDSLAGLLDQVLDINNRFQFVIARTHMKVCIFETSKGNKFVIHGSANLRSSANYENLMIENNPDLYDFIAAFHAELKKKYKVIDKEIPKKF